MAKLSVINSNHPQPPRKLAKHGLTLWHTIHNSYDVSDAGGLEILAQLCSSLDRAEALRETVERDGEMIKTRTGMRIHPAIREELAARSFVVRSLERLGLNVEAVKSVGRPGGYSAGWDGGK